MHTTNLRKVGGSIMLAVPPSILELLNLQPGATLGITVDAGRLIVEPLPKPHYSLDQLLAQCDSSAKISDEDLTWINAKPVGHEL